MSDCCTDTPTRGSEVAAQASLQVLLDNHDRFLRFLERRVGSRDAAEEILQEAYVRGITRAPATVDEESVTAWFYRVLRNAMVDHHRKRSVRDRALEKVASEPEEPVPSVDAELMSAVCSCVSSLVGTLKPEYAEAVRRVDVDGASMGEFAEETGITPNNARVRLHRAREALRRQVAASCGSCAEGGCRDCSCDHPSLA